MKTSKGIPRDSKFGAHVEIESFADLIERFGEKRTAWIFFLRSTRREFPILEVSTFKNLWERHTHKDFDHPTQLMTSSSNGKACQLPNLDSPQAEP